jgi:uncharacterized membrane-anchored protein
MADSNGVGYERGALVFAAGLIVIGAAYFCTNVSRTLLFWGAFILTRPLGATVGDLLDKPVANGGLAFGRFYASAILTIFIVAYIVLLPQRAGKHPETAQEIRSAERALVRATLNSRQGFFDRLVRHCQASAL